MAKTIKTQISLLRIAARFEFLLTKFPKKKSAFHEVVIKTNKQKYLKLAKKSKHCIEAAINVLILFAFKLTLCLLTM